MNPQKKSFPGRICASLFEALDALWTAINSTRGVTPAFGVLASLSDVAVELVLTALIVPKLRDRLAGKLS